MRALLKGAALLFDALEAWWESRLTLRRIGSLLLVVFLGSMAAIELNRDGLLPPALGAMLPTSHFYAVDVALTLLLFFEIVSLTLNLARSVSVSLGKQFEVLSLILIRQAFKHLADFQEPVEWTQVKPAVAGMLALAAGAMAIFVILGLYYRLQRHRPITGDAERTASYIAGKKLISLSLLVIFALIGIWVLGRQFSGREAAPYFEYCYTVLVFNDVLLVLLSLRYSSVYSFVFRNSGYALATVFMRLALTAPAGVSALLAVVSALYALGLTLAYNSFYKVFEEREARNGKGAGQPGGQGEGTGDVR
jgi:hypothetical protein